MTPEIWYREFRELQDKVSEHEDLADKCTYPKKAELRKAHSGDIKVGNLIYYPSRPRPFWEIIEEVLHPDDDFKAFNSVSGCRYGLSGAFVRVKSE